MTMTQFKKLLLAGAAGIALMAGPAFANDPAGSSAGTDIAPPAATGDVQIDGAIDTNGAAGADSIAQLESLGYTDVEPVDAQGDAAAEGEALFTATNADGERVNVRLDTESGTVISEDAAY
jgi:hypothetical protein